MKTNYAIAKKEYRNLIITIGYGNILNMHITEVVNRTGVSYLDMQNARSYFEFSPQQESFRRKYYSK